MTLGLTLVIQLFVELLFKSWSCIFFTHWHMQTDSTWKPFIGTFLSMWDWCFVDHLMCSPVFVWNSIGFKSKVLAGLKPAFLCIETAMPSTRTLNNLPCSIHPNQMEDNFTCDLTYCILHMTLKTRPKNEKIGSRKNRARIKWIKHTSLGKDPLIKNVIKKIYGTNIGKKCPLSVYF